jgi:hypothetical protein
MSSDMSSGQTQGLAFGEHSIPISSYDIPPPPLYKACSAPLPPIGKQA